MRSNVAWIESPRRRPFFPEKPADVATVLLETLPPALGVEVPLVPVRALGPRRSGRPRRQRVLDVVAADRDERANAFGCQDRRDARRAPAPVVAGERGRPQREGVHELEQVLTDRGLLRHSRRLRIEKARRAVAPQIGHQHPAARGGQRRGHVVERARVVREAVEQHDGHAARVSVRLVADLERSRPDLEDVGHRNR